VGRKGGRTRAGLRTEVMVLLEVVESVNEVMKFPNARFVSIVGTIRCNDTSYGVEGTMLGIGIRA